MVGPVLGVRTNGLPPSHIFLEFAKCFLVLVNQTKVIAAIAATGTNVVVSGGSVSEMALHFCEKYKLMCIKVQSKWDLRRLCATVGATALVRMGPATPEEMGKCHKVSQRLAVNTGRVYTLK